MSNKSPTSIDNVIKLRNFNDIASISRSSSLTQDEIYDCYSWTENTQLSYIEDEVHNIMTIIRVK